MLACEIGLPAQVSEHDLHVDMPSPHTDGQFTDVDYITANIGLARIAGRLMAEIYSRRKHEAIFLQRAQTLLKALRDWMETLPATVRLSLDQGNESRGNIISLHLMFNQVKPS